MSFNVPNNVDHCPFVCNEQIPWDKVCTNVDILPFKYLI